MKCATEPGNGSRNDVMCFFRLLKKGVVTLACHAHFIQSKNQQMNFASEWLKISLFVSR